jgi:hypothetical protein
MTINITPEIDAAYGAFLDEQIDAFMDGVAIRRRDTHPYAGAESSGLIDFAAGYQAARAVLSSPVAAQPADSAMEVLRELVAIEDLQRSRAQAEHHAAKFPSPENYVVVDKLWSEIARRRTAAWDRARALIRQGDTA